MGIVTFFAVRFAEVALVVSLLVFLPNIPPNANFSQFKVAPSLSLDGKLALNERLNNVEHLYKDELKGAEAFTVFNGELYTTIHGGDVVKLSHGHIVPVAKFGRPCTGHVEESVCGRPLGLRFDKHGVLYVADAYYGIWKVDVQTGHKTQLVSMNTEIEGKKPMVPNSLVVADNGDIYWTDSSTEFSLEDGVYIFLADASGRLIHYNSKTGKNSVLMSNLHFANGIILSENEDYLLISETLQSRIIRYYLKGNKKGLRDTFIDGLPGMPDNLQPDGQGGLFVPLVSARDADHPAVFQIFGPFPLVRKFFARILGLTHLGFKTIHNLYPNVYSLTAIHWIGHFEPLGNLAPSRSSVLHVSQSGEILDALHGDDGSMTFISDAIVFGDHLYLGSPYVSHVGRISLEKAGLTHLSVDKIKRETVQKAQTAPTPKQTTAPPPTAAPAKQTAPPVKQTPPPTPKQAPPTPKQAPPPTQAPPTPKQAPPPTQAPPPVKQAPVKQAPPPPAKQAPPPPAKQAPPPVVKQAPPPAAAPVKQAPPPAAAPVKQAPPPAAAPVKQAPPPAAAPVKQAPPPTAAPVKQAPTPVKQAPPPSPVKQAPPPAAANQAAPSTPKPAVSAEKLKESQGPKAVPVKENVRPKSESIQPRK